MSHKLLTLNVRGLNSSRKRRQVFRRLHLQRSDIIFLQETYSSTGTIKRWEAEWGGKVVASHGTTHSKGVMVLFKPNLNVTINKTLADKNGRYVLAETSIDETNIVFVNINAPNDPSQQIVFLRDLSSSVLSAYVNENLVLGGDFNCVMNAMDKIGGKPFDSKNAAVTEFESTIRVHSFVDAWRKVNPSMKIQSRLDYFFISKFLQKLIQECRIMPNIFSDHSALILTICFDEETALRGPGYWRFNNSLLSDNEYVALLRSKIPEFIEKYKEVEDKGLFWEMVKMEIRELTVRFSKLKVKRNRDEEKLLTSRFAQLSAKLQTAYSKDDKAELERIKIKFSDFQTEKTRGAIIRSRGRWYEHGEKNSKYFLNLEKLNYWRKHISSLINHNGTRINDPKEILNEERNFFKELYSSGNVDPNSEEFSDFFNVDFQLP